MALVTSQYVRTLPRPYPRADFRGRPPFAPFARAAAALAGDLARPASRAIWDPVPNNPASKPGTDRSASSASNATRSLYPGFRPRRVGLRRSLQPLCQARRETKGAYNCQLNDYPAELRVVASGCSARLVRCRNLAALQRCVDLGVSQFGHEYSPIAPIASSAPWQRPA